MKKNLQIAIVFAALAALPQALFAGGAWIPAPGKGDIQFGASRKAADSSWDAAGDYFNNTRLVNGRNEPNIHDFRYGYLTGEIGIVKRLSGTFTLTYLDGYEGTRDALEENQGASDAWFGAKYQLRGGSWPMALGLNLRTPVFYDQGGPYSRYIYSDRHRTKIKDTSPEWRGLLKKDLTLSYLASRSFEGGKAWANAEIGYMWREGAPADGFPFMVEYGHKLPFWNAAIKGCVMGTRSRYNDSIPQPDDRFRPRSDGSFNFNTASYVKAGVSFMTAFGQKQDYTLEFGYNQWVWGESARIYKEPYFAFGRTF